MEKRNIQYLLKKSENSEMLKHLLDLGSEVLEIACSRVENSIDLEAVRILLDYGLVDDAILTNTFQRYIDQVEGNYMFHRGGFFGYTPEPSIGQSELHIIKLLLEYGHQLDNIYLNSDLNENGIDMICLFIEFGQGDKIASDFSEYQRILKTKERYSKRQEIHHQMLHQIPVRANMLTSSPNSIRFHLLNFSWCLNDYSKYRESSLMDYFGIMNEETYQWKISGYAKEFF